MEIVRPGDFIEPKSAEDILREVAAQCDDLKNAARILRRHPNLPGITPETIQGIWEYRTRLIMEVPASIEQFGLQLPNGLNLELRAIVEEAQDALDRSDHRSMETLLTVRDYELTRSKGNWLENIADRISE